LARLDKCFWRIVECGSAVSPLLAQVERTEFSSTDARRVRQYGLKNRAKLSWEAADDIENFSGRTLLFQRFIKLASQVFNCILAILVGRWSLARSSLRFAGISVGRHKTPRSLFLYPFTPFHRPRP